MGGMDELEVEWNSKSLNNFEEKELCSYSVRIKRVDISMILLKILKNFGKFSR